MKKLFSALLILISINCFSQTPTTGYLRYDTVKVMKQNGNSNLIIENATRDSLGFLYNYGGGRTRFEVIRAVPGGIKVGGDTIINDQSGACEDMILNPGYVTYSGTGLKFYITNAIYRINCVVYTTTYDSVTLSASDPDDPRKDVIYAATTGIEVLTGTPAGPAAEPQLDGGQLKLTVVDIPALATTPGLTQNIIWDENTESVVTNVGTTTDPDNLTNVYHLTKSINVSNIGTGDQIILTLPSTINAASFDALSLFIKAKALISNSTTSIRVTFFNSTTAVSSEITLGHDATSLDYRGISIPISRFQFNNTFFDKIRIRWISSAGVHAGFYLDYVYLVSGLLQPGGSGTPLTIGPIDTKISSQNGAVIENNVFYNQTASQTNPGLLSPADKTKLDSIRWKYFLENSPYGAPLFRQLDDSTAIGRGITGIGGIVVTYDDDTITIDGSGIAGGSQDLQDVTDIGNTTTDTVNAAAFGITNGHIFNESGDFTIRGRTGSTLFLGADDSNKWFITPSGRLGETGAGDLGAYTFQSTLGTSRFKDMVMEYEAAPGTPSAGLGILYTKSSDKKIYWKDDDGVEYDLTDGGGGISLTTTGSSGVATLVGSVLNVPDYSSGSSIWNGVVIGTTFSATGTTINSGAVQWTFTGSSPATFTLPARTSSVNQFYIIKNIGSADLTVAAAGTDDIFTTSSVASITVVPGGSVMITGAANGTSDLWTALFHTGASSGGGFYINLDNLKASAGNPVTDLDTLDFSDDFIDAFNEKLDTTTDNNLVIVGSTVNTNKAPLTLTDGATITWDATLGFNAKVTIAGNRTLDITNPQAGQYYKLTVRQDGTGTRTLALPSGSWFENGIDIVLTTTASAYDVLIAYYDGTNYFWKVAKDWKP